jgi:cytochrome c biogenesis protein CcmG, thiol:disulfide interchange protein DsbE
MTLDDRTTWIATVVCVALVMSGGWLLMQGVDTAQVGSTAPAISATDLEGHPLSADDLEGKVVLLNIWATWCEPCRAEMPSMQRLHARFQDEPFVVVAISIDGARSEEVVMERIGRFVDDLGLEFSVAHDSRQVTRRRYQVRGLPESFLIDQEGVIRNRIIGAVDWDAPEYVEMVEAVLERNPEAGS